MANVTSAAAPGDEEDQLFARLYVCLAPLYLAPLFATRFLPAFDLPHHLAIVDALTKSNRADSPYADQFVVGFQLAPFVAHLVLLRALAAFTSVSVAAKLLVAAVVLTLPLAAARLLRVGRRDTWPAVVALPLAYSMPLHFGLIAFVLALPFLVWMMAEALNERGWNARPMRAALRLGALSLVTFCTHLEAWGVGAVAAAAALLAGSMPRRTRFLGLASLIPSVALCALYLARTTSDPVFGSRPSFVRAVLAARLQEIAAHGVIADLWDRVRVAPVHLLRGFHDGSDVAAARVLFVLIGVGVLVRLASSGLAWPRPRWRVTPAAAVVLVGLAAYFGLPHHAPPDAHSVYPRFAVVLALLLLLMLPAAPRAGWTARLRRVPGVLLALLLAAYGLTLVQHYAAFGRELADFEQILAASPSGLSAGGLVFEAESTVMNVDGIFSGMPEYYVTERAGPRTSTWLYYCDTPQLPCHMRHPDQPAPLPHFSTPSAFDATAALQALELIYVRGGPPAAQIFGDALPRVRLLAERGHWRAYVRVGPAFTRSRAAGEADHGEGAGTLHPRAAAPTCLPQPDRSASARRHTRA